MSAVELKTNIEPEAKKMKLDMTANAAKQVLRWAKLTDKAFEPVRGSARAAGLDMRSAYDVVVPARGKALVKTDVQIQVPEGCYGRIAPRSGLALKHFIDVGAGVVDEDYRGNLGVILFNHSDEEFVVKRGDRIAQLICERIFYPELEQVEKLAETERGTGGFGSTGVGEEAEAKKNGAENGNCVAKEETDAAKASTKSETAPATDAAADAPMPEKEAVAT